MRRLGPALAGILIGLLLAVGVALLAPGVLRPVLDRAVRGPDPTTIVDVSLRSVQKQARLTVFAASFATVITSEQQRFGLSARKTMIVPGTVRYTVDLSRLTRADLTWDAPARTLTLRAPAVQVEGPEIDLRRIQEYRDGTLLFALTDAEQALDSANRARVQTALLQQARAPALLALANEAADEALQRSFALPLRAAGIEATVVVRR